MSDITVLVDSRGGNTRKLADAIAEELGVKVSDIGASLPDDTMVLFLGSGTYGGKPGKNIMKFIDSGNFSGRKIALFGTSMSPAGSQKMIAVMNDAVKKKGATIVGNYHCGGKFLLFNRGHPDEADLENAKEFAREIREML
jgi:flavodoxin